MALPRVIKNMNVFNEGESFIGEAKTVTLPTLTRKMEDYRGAGMSGTVKIDMGMEALEMKIVFGGLVRAFLAQFGITQAAGAYLRFAGAIQRDDTGEVDSIEIVVRGRHSEMEMGDAEVGELADFTVTTALAYYKLTWNGSTLIEIDPLNMIEIVDGVDRLAEQRSAIGLF